MVSHFFPDGKFLKPFHDRYRAVINETDRFYVYGEAKGFPKLSCFNTIYESDIKGFWQNAKFIIKTIKASDKVVFHSFFFSRTLYFLLPLIARRYGHKMCWLVWGGDLGDYYQKEITDKRIRTQLRGFLRRRIIYHLGYILGPTDDYDFLITHYKTKSVKNKYAYYSYPIVNRDPSVLQNYIMIGHSAHPSSQHVQSYELLSRYPLLEDDYLYSNLSYGYSDRLHGESQDAYVQRVINKGQALFGDKYLPDLKFCSYNEYVEKLMKVKVAIFNNDRGQGFSNIANMLHFGTKLYMNPQNTLYSYFKNLGAVILSIEDLDESFAQPLSDEDRERNVRLIEELFSDEAFVKTWTLV